MARITSSGFPRGLLPSCLKYTAPTQVHHRRFSHSFSVVNRTRTFPLPNQKLNLTSVCQAQQRQLSFAVSPLVSGKCAMAILPQLWTNATVSASRFLGVELQRGFSTSVTAHSNMGMGGSIHQKNNDRGRVEEEQEGAMTSVRQSGSKAFSERAGDWGVRLANENGYLSWCRNTYLTTVVAIAMLGEGTTAMSVQAAEGAFFVAGLNLTWGTYQFVYNVVRLRQRMTMTRTAAFLNIGMAILHLALWFMVCSLYMGYSEEPDTVKLIEEEASRQRNQDV